MVGLRRSQQRMWVGRGAFGVIMLAVVAYLYIVGLDKADKLGSSIGGVVALVALVAPYLLPRSRRENVGMSEDASTDGVVVKDSGDAKATGGGEATTGVETIDGDTGAVRVVRSGKAVADGSGS